MRVPSGSAHTFRAGRLIFASLPNYGRTAPYRRLANSAATLRNASPTTAARQIPLSSSILLRSTLEPQQLLVRSALLSSRHFHSNAALAQEEKKKDVKDKPKPKEEKKAAKPEEEKKEAKEEEKAESATGEESEENKSKDEKKEKEDEEKPPPPPPHGDKTPWQVFTETLRTEFKASKEWNESTKALSSGYEEFTQNPTMQKAKSKYGQAADAASKTTSAAGKALGKGASWTWETPVVKGVRKSVNAAGRGIEQATRPIRETEAYKSLEKTIDDGSSSRYGGWVEKEERRKKREAREAAELAKTGGRPSEPAVEDPEYAPLYHDVIHATS